MGNKKLLIAPRALLIGLTLIGLASCNESTVATDTVAPVVTVNDSKATSFVRKSVMPDWTTYFTATDDVDGTINVTESMITSTVDPLTVGNYKVTANIQDEAGNKTTKSIDVEITQSFTADMAAEFYQNSTIDVLANTPDSLLSVDGVAGMLSRSENDCEYNSNATKEEYYWCVLPQTIPNPQSDIYGDILFYEAQFNNIKTYTDLIQDVFTDIINVVDNPVIGAVQETVDGHSKLTNILGYDSESYILEQRLSLNIDGLQMAFDVYSELYYDIDTSTYTSTYNFSIQVGYSFLTVNTYELYATATFDSSYELQETDVYSRIPLIRTLATHVTVNEDSIEISSYHSVVGMYDTKTYIYANDDYGYKYKWKSIFNDFLFLDPAVTFEVFDNHSTIFSSKMGDDEQGTSKFYYAGLEGWEKIQYRIEGGFLATDDHNTVITYVDGSTYTFTEKEYDDDEIYYITQAENGYEYSLDDEGKLVETKTDYIVDDYDGEALYLKINSKKGNDVNLFELPSELGLTIRGNLDIEQLYRSSVTRVAEIKVFDKTMFDSAFSLSIPGFELSFDV